MIIEDSKDKVLQLIQNQLNPDKFENLVRWYFQKAGATSVHIPAKNERDKKGDADIVATFEPIKTTIYVQAKHHRKITGDWGLEQVEEYKSHKDEMDDDGNTKIAWVVTSGDGFSDECMSKAKEYNVVLIDGTELASMLLNAGISSMDNAV